MHHAPAFHGLCNRKWSPPGLARSMKIGPSIDEGPGDFRVPLQSRNVQRSPAILADSMKIGASINEKLSGF